MSWIKRNLLFVIGAAVAVVLMGLAGYFAFSKWTLNNEAWTSLSADYEKLKELNGRNPHPGSGQVDNVELAKKQRDQLTNYVFKAQGFFQPIPRIPDTPKVNDQEFSAALARTVEQLQRAATNSGVALPASYPDYYFSFQAQKSKISFAAGSPARLAVQLGEVKTIVDVLVGARINGIDAISRERVSTDDSYGPLSDYVIEKTTTNQLASLDNVQALITPYAITFRCFSTDLAAVLSAFAGSPHGFVVKNFNVERAPAPAASDAPAVATPVQPQLVYQTPQAAAGNDEAMQRQSAAANFARRYGVRGGGGGGAAQGGIQFRGLESRAETPAFTAPGVLPVAAAPAKTGPQIVLDEKLLKVTMNLGVVKLAPVARAETPAAPAAGDAAAADPSTNNPATTN